jgi:hypothetical protein
VTRTLRRSFHAYDKGGWRVNHQVERWVADWKRAEQPFFAFLHYKEPHIRYEAVYAAAQPYSGKELGSRCV